MVTVGLRALIGGGQDGLILSLPVDLMALGLSQEALVRSSLWNWLEAAAKEERRMKTVDRKTLKRWLGQQNLFLMDVRSPVAWNLSIAKIEYARRCEENSLALVVQTLPRQQKLVLYCEDGMANCPAMAKKLEKMGFTNLYLLKGGFLAWQGKEYPKVPKEVEEQSETSANL